MHKSYFTVEKCAEYLGCSRYKVRRWIDEDPTFPWHKVGAIFVIPKKKLERWIDSEKGGRR